MEWSQPDGGAGRENYKMNVDGSYRGADLLRDGGVDGIPRFSEKLLGFLFPDPEICG